MAVSHLTATPSRATIKHHARGRNCIVLKRTSRYCPSSLKIRLEDLGGEFAMFRRATRTAAALAAVPIVLSLSTLIPAHADAAGAGGVFVATQGRVLDTRQATAVGPYSTPMTAGVWRQVPVAGLAGVPTTGVNAVQLTVTAMRNGTSGSISLSADVSPEVPQTAVDYGAATGGTSNTAIVPLASTGNIKVEATSATDVLIDVQGYFTAPGSPGTGYVPISPTRIASTKSGLGMPAAGQVSGGSTVTIQVAGVNGIPSDASAIFANIAVGSTTSTEGGYVTPYPADQPRPRDSLLFTAGTITELGSSIGLSASGAMNLDVNSPSPVDIWIDVEGYYEGSSSQSFLTDSTEVANQLVIAPNSSATVQVAGVGDIPESSYSVSAAAAEIQATPSGSDAGYLIVWPTGGTRPNTSELNLQGSPNPVSNFDTSALSASGAVQIYNASPDTVTVTIDVEGFYVPASDSAAGDNFYGASSGSEIDFNSTADSATIAAAEGWVDTLDPSGTVVGEALTSPSAGAVTSSTDTTSSAGTTTVARADGVTTTWTDTSGAAQTSSYACVKAVDPGGRVVLYGPWKFPDRGNSWSYYWVDWIYQVHQATFSTSYGWQRQEQDCAVGGGKVWNGYRMTFSGVGFADAQTDPKLIGWRWGTGVAKDGAIHTSLDFSLDSGKASIGAHVDLTPADTYTGDLGNNKHITCEKANLKCKYYANEVNGYYTAPTTWKFNGTKDWEGNTVHGLYQYNDQAAGKSYPIQPALWGHCSKIFGSCPSFN